MRQYIRKVLKEQAHMEKQVKLFSLFLKRLFKEEFTIMQQYGHGYDGEHDTNSSCPVALQLYRMNGMTCMHLYVPPYWDDYEDVSIETDATGDNYPLTIYEEACEKVKRLAKSFFGLEINDVEFDLMTPEITFGGTFSYVLFDDGREINSIEHALTHE